MDDLRLEAVEFAHPDAVRLIEQVQAEYAVLYGESDRTPLDPAMFVPPAGTFFVGYLGDEAVATGAWRARPDLDAASLGLPAGLRLAEIKRMYVAPAARGRGAARTILRRLERSAAASGFEAMVLESGDKQPAALALYRAGGYDDVEGYGIYRDEPESVYLGRLLDDVAGPGCGEPAPR